MSRHFGALISEIVSKEEERPHVQDASGGGGGGGREEEGGAATSVDKCSTFCRQLLNNSDSTQRV